jgi:Na+/melibiose symporter-like transporter
MDPQEFASAERRAGKSAAATAAALKQTSHLSAAQTAKALEAAGYAANDVASALKQVFGLSA